MFWFVIHGSYILFIFFSHHSVVVFCEIKNGPVFWKWKYDKWKYMWSVHEWCNGKEMSTRMWNTLELSNKKWRKTNEIKHKKIACSNNSSKITWYNFFMLGFFFWNNNKDVDVECPQIMRCIICYNNPIFFCNLKIWTNKWNNNIKKTCECKPFYYYKNVWRGSKYSIERGSG